MRTHTHTTTRSTTHTQVSLSPGDVHNLKTGQKSNLRKVSTEDNAHSHYVEVGTCHTQ